jgi:hypothetical protein
MILEEADKQLTPEHRTLINTVGENEIVVVFLLRKKYHTYVAKPFWEPGQEIRYGQWLGTYPTLEEVKKHIAELPFASDIDSNGWVVSLEKKQDSLID